MNDAARRGIDRIPGRIERILVPTDFSAYADEAFAWALALARQEEATVHLLHVMIPLESDAYSPLRYSPEAAASHDRPDDIVVRLLKSTVDKFERGNVNVEVVKQRGRAVGPVLLNYIRKEQIDLVVMGTHGRRGFRHALLGSVAEEVVRRAACSVMTVRRRDGDAPGSIDRVLAPVDFSEASEAVLRAAAAMARSHGASLDVLHVIEPLPYIGIFKGVLTAYDLVPDLKDRAYRELHRLIEQLEVADLAVKVHVEEGHAASKILDFAEGAGTDLIVMATHGRSGVEHFLVGSITERVVRLASCPVLVAREPWVTPEERSTSGRREEAGRLRSR